MMSCSVVIMAADLLSGHVPRLRALGEPGFGEGALGLDFGHPPSDDGGVRAGFEGGPVLAELGVATGDVLAGLLGCPVVLRIPAGRRLARRWCREAARG